MRRLWTMTRTFFGLLRIAVATLTLAEEPQTGERSVERVRSKLFRHQYTIYDREFCGSEVCVDFDHDGRRELLYASRAPGKLQMLDAADGKLLWRVEGLSEEDSPNVADLDGDGSVDVVGMTFGGEAYCLDAKGRFQWRRDLRPELDELDLGESRYWGHAFVCNLDDDPYLELAVSGYGGLDVIETRGFGPNTEHFQRRRSYQRLNVRPWAYEDSFFIERGLKRSVTNLTDNLILAKKDGGHARDGRFVTELLTLPPNCEFDCVRFSAETPARTQVRVDVLDSRNRPLREGVASETELRIREPIRLSFRLSTTDPATTPKLDSYSLKFDKAGR